MATKAELQAQIATYNTQLNTLKNDKQSLLNATPALKQSVLDWITGYNNDYAHCGTMISVSGDALDSGTVASFAEDGCHSDLPLNRCSKQGCKDRIATINTALANFNQNISAVKSKDAEIKNILALIQSLNDQILALPESQAQIQGAVASAAANADAEKKKWVIFGIVVLVIVIGSIVIYIRVRK